MTKPDLPQLPVVLAASLLLLGCSLGNKHSKEEVEFSEHQRTKVGVQSSNMELDRNLCRARMEKFEREGNIEAARAEYECVFKNSAEIEKHKQEVQKKNRESSALRSNCPECRNSGN